MAERITDHLVELLSIDRTQDNYDAIINVEIKRYRDFCKKIQVKEFDPESDKIYVEITRGEYGSFKSFLAKSRGKEALIGDLKVAFDRQRKYFDEHLKTKSEQRAMRACHSLSDAMIQTQEYERDNALMVNEWNPLSKYYWDAFLSELSSEWREFNGYMNKIFNMVFSSYYDKKSAPFLQRGIDEFDSIIDDEKTYYYAIKKNNENLAEKVSEDNPYKNMYLYMRNAFILNFFEIDLPGTSNFLGFSKFEVEFTKGEYSLRDIAELYAQMTDQVGTEDKLYQRIKKLFQKLGYMQRFKDNKGEYVFEKKLVSIPLAEYAYYRRKNHKGSSVVGIDFLISDRYAPILNALMHGQKDLITAYEKLRGFWLKEYRELFSSLSDMYQRSMKQYLIESGARILARASGLKKQDVYVDWKQVVEGGDYS